MTTATRAANLRLNNPCMTLQDIANKCGVSKERVRQVLKEQALNTSHIRLSWVCINCGKRFYWFKPRPFCSWVCYKEYHWVPLICKVCGKLFYRLLSQIKRDSKVHQNKVGDFCSNQCKGSFVAHEYGFIAHPENIDGHNRKGKSKYDFMAIYYYKQDHTWAETRKRFNVPCDTGVRQLLRMAKEQLRHQEVSNDRL